MPDRGFSAESTIMVEPGEVLGLWGDSGCGKTSILRAIAGLDFQPDVQVRLDGEAWQAENSFVPVHKRRIGFVFQSPSLFDFMNVERNLLFGYRRSSQSVECDDWFDRIVDLTGVRSLLNRIPRTLSGGQRQRVALARTLCSQPKLLLLDEPMSALDQRNKNQILPFLKSIILELETPCVYVSHHLEEIARISDRVAVIHEGRVVRADSTRNLLTDLEFIAEMDNDAVGVFDATVENTDAIYGLVSIQSPLGPLQAIYKPHMSIGDAIKIAIRPKDVSISLEENSVSSILNRLKGEVVEIVDLDEAQSLVKISIGESALIAKITRKSKSVLKLQVGDSVLAQIKSIAIV